jgi:hypothetical protein
MLRLQTCRFGRQVTGPGISRLRVHSLENDFSQNTKTMFRPTWLGPTLIELPLLARRGQAIPASLLINQADNKIPHDRTSLFDREPSYQPFVSDRLRGAAKMASPATELFRHISRRNQFTDPASGSAPHPVKPQAGFSLIFGPRRGGLLVSMSALSLPHSSADWTQPAERNATPISARGVVQGEAEDGSRSWPNSGHFDRPRVQPENSRHRSEIHHGATHLRHRGEPVAGLERGTIDGGWNQALCCCGRGIPTL